MDSIELQLNEVSCSKDVSGNSFSKGLQEYPFSVGRPSAWIPAQSYFRLQLSLRKKTGPAEGAHTPPSYLADRVAFAENVAACLYTNVTFKAGGQDVSSILAYIPQAAQLKTRLNKSLGWQKSVGNGCYMVESSFENRSKKVSSAPYGMSDPEYLVPHGVTGITTSSVTAATGVVTFNDSSLITSGVKAGDLIVIEKVPYVIESVDTALTLTLQGGAAAVGGNIAATLDFYILSSTQEDEGIHSIFVLWQPPIAIFDHQGALGGGDYKFSMTPNAEYQNAGIESKFPIVIGTAAGQFQLVVEDVKFYAASAKMVIPEQIQTLKMFECQIDSKVARGGAGTYQFQVPPSTMALSVWLQANEAGFDTRYSPTSFRTTNKSERTMSAIQITYGNVSKPNTQWSASFDNNQATPSQLKNLLQQRYYDTYRECDLLSNDGGIETFDDFLSRGMVVHYSFVRDSEDKATNVQISLTSGVLPPNSRIFVAAWVNTVAEITTDNGSVVAVRKMMT
jgi:hypothetical protein